MASFLRWLGLSRTKHSALSPSVQFIGRHFGVDIKDTKLYEQALTHRSYDSQYSNERLEYLGDAVLDLVSAEYTYKHFPEMNEGDLTKMRSKLISRTNLSAIARSEGFLKQLELKKQKDLDAGLIVGNVLEAIYGALYLDQGYNITCRLAYEMLERSCDIDALANDLHDVKSLLLEWGQKNKESIRLQVETTKGEQFMARVLLNGEWIATGKGSSKKRAEKDACRIALSKLDIR